MRQKRWWKIKTLWRPSTSIAVFDTLAAFIPAIISVILPIRAAAIHAVGGVVAAIDTSVVADFGSGATGENRQEQQGGESGVVVVFFHER